MNLILTSDEKGVPCEHGFVVAIFEKEAYGVLGMAWSVKSGDFDGVTHSECRLVCWCFGHFVAVFAAYDGKRV